LSEQATLSAPGSTGNFTDKPFVITVCSGKGGVGKSILTANLALGLASAELPVIVWDADMTFPNQHILFGVEPPLRSYDVYNGMVSTDAALFSVTDYLSLLAGKTGVGPMDTTPEELNKVRRELFTKKAAVLLIDTAAGSSDDVLQCCAFADLILVVVTDEPPSIVDAYGLIKILQNNAPSAPLALVVNNTIDAEDAEEVVRKMNMATERFLRRKVGSIGFVPYDRAVRTSIVEQQPLLRMQPNSEAAVAIRSLARLLAGALRRHRREA
jgi:flagellar biosynthesis protein FlhG